MKKMFLAMMIGLILIVPLAMATDDAVDCSCDGSTDCASRKAAGGVGIGSGSGAGGSGGGTGV